MSLEEKSPTSLEAVGIDERQEDEESKVLDKIVQEAIIEAKSVFSQEATPEELAGTIRKAIDDFIDLSERYRKKAEDIKAKLSEDVYKNNKKELLRQMTEEKNPEVLLFLSQEYQNAEDESFGAKSRADIYDSLAKYFETTAKMFGTYIALDKLGDRKSLISSAFEASLSGKYWKAKCKLFPKFPLSPIKPMRSYPVMKSIVKTKSW